MYFYQMECRVLRQFWGFTKVVLFYVRFKGYSQIYFHYAAFFGLYIIVRLLYLKFDGSNVQRITKSEDSIIKTAHAICCGIPVIVSLLPHINSTYGCGGVQNMFC
jgi:hypothetical protein